MSISDNKEQRTRQLLARAKGLIENPRNWTQGSYARTEGGYTVNSNGPSAVCFCSIGALQRAEYEGAFNVSDYWHASTILRGVMGCHIASFNDASTHDEVLAAFDEAINS